MREARTEGPRAGPKDSREGKEGAQEIDADGGLDIVGKFENPFFQSRV